MGYLNCFPATFVAAGSQQALPGQLLHQPPVLVAHLLAGRQPARVGRTRAGLHQLDEDVSRRVLLVGVQALEDRLGVVGQRPLNLADGLVGLVRQQAQPLPFPQ